MPDKGKILSWKSRHLCPLWVNPWKADNMEHICLDDKLRIHAGMAFGLRPEIPRQH